MHSLGIECTPAGAKQLVKIIDVDGSNLIEMDECVSYVTRVRIVASVDVIVIIIVVVVDDVDDVDD